MKIKYLVFLAAAGILLFSACKSSPRPRGKDFSPHAPLALVTVVSNQDINWEGEKTREEDFISGFIRNTLRLNRDASRVRISSADTMIDEADEILRKVIADARVFVLADKERITDSHAYWTSSRNANLPSGQIVAQGYRYLNHRDRQFAAQLSEENGVRSLLYVNFTFNKKMVSGFAKTGRCRALVKMRAVVVSPQGKTVFRYEIETRSSDRIDVKSGSYDEEEFMDLLREAIGEACYRFIWKFRGTRI
ncbi:MAG: hypothetical protein FWG99_01190 [Treponema sp.]|nr:hypothetical protein [Treponema sp.]